MTQLGIQYRFGGPDFEDVAQILSQYGPAGLRALNRAVRKVTRSSGSQAGRDLAKRSRVPLRVLMKGGGSSRGQRVFIRAPRASDKSPSGSVWVGYEPIRAAYVGRLQQLRRGARAGKHRFEGTFVATMPSGHTGIFRRRGKRRLQIDEETVDLEVAQDVMQQIHAEGRTRLRDVALAELNYEVNVRR